MRQTRDMVASFASSRRRLIRRSRFDTAPRATGALRRRVLAGVRREDERISTVRGALAPTARRGAALLLTCVLGALALMLALGGRGTPMRPAGAQAHASLRISGGRGELDFRALPEPLPGRTYEVWLSTAGGQLRATDALFTPTSDGRATVEVPGTLRGVSAVAITSEPLGGSRSPTGPVQLVLKVPPRR